MTGNQLICIVFRLLGGWAKGVRDKFDITVSGTIIGKQLLYPVAPKRSSA